MYSITVHGHSIRVRIEWSEFGFKASSPMDWPGHSVVASTPEKACARLEGVLELVADRAVYRQREWDRARFGHQVRVIPT